MSIELYFIAIMIAFAALYFLVPPVLGAYLKFRGKRLIVCPETRRPAAVDVDVKHASLTAILGEPHLRLKTCSRWPERQDCGQECLLQIELAPEDCLVRKLLTDWYAGKTCVICSRPFGEIHLLDHKPALMSPEGKTIEWCDFRPETIYEVLTTHKPVCWDCHITETFRRQYPELVVDRSSSSEVRTAAN